MATAAHHLDWNDLKLVMAIAETGGPGKAAEALGLDATTVARHLQRMERRLGTPLFERKRSGYQPTAEGDMLLSLAVRVDGDVRDVTRRIRAGQSPRGSVRVATSDCVLEHLLVPQLPRFRALHPEISITAIIGNGEVNLSREEADIALRVTNQPGETLAGRRIGSMAWALYGPAARPGQGRSHGTTQEWVALGGDLSHAKAAVFVQQNVDARRIAYTANSVSAMVHAIAQGVGMGYLPCFVGDVLPALARLEPPPAALSEDLWLLTHPELRRSARVRTVIDFFLVGILAQRALLEGQSGTQV